MDVQEKQMTEDLTADGEIGNVEALTKEYPDAAEDLRAFQQGRGD